MKMSKKQHCCAACVQQHLAQVQLHQLVQKRGNDLRLAQTHRIVKRLEVNEIGTVDAGSFAEHSMRDGPSAALQRTVFDVVWKFGGERYVEKIRGLRFRLRCLRWGWL